MAWGPEVASKVTQVDNLKEVGQMTVPDIPDSSLGVRLTISSLKASCFQLNGDCRLDKLLKNRSTCEWIVSSALPRELEEMDIKYNIAQPT
jgi:hypothetical protein